MTQVDVAVITSDVQLVYRELTLKNAIRISSNTWSLNFPTSLDTDDFRTINTSDNIGEFVYSYTTVLITVYGARTVVEYFEQTRGIKYDAIVLHNLSSSIPVHIRRQLIDNIGSLVDYDLSRLIGGLDDFI